MTQLIVVQGCFTSGYANSFSPGFTSSPISPCFTQQQAMVGRPTVQLSHAILPPVNVRFTRFSDYRCRWAARISESGSPDAPVEHAGVNRIRLLQVDPQQQRKLTHRIDANVTGGDGHPASG